MKKLKRFKYILSAIFFYSFIGIPITLITWILGFTNWKVFLCNIIILFASGTLHQILHKIENGEL